MNSRIYFSEKKRCSIGCRICQLIGGKYTHIHVFTCAYFRATSPVAQTVKHLPAMWETWVQSLGQEDPLEKEMATHSSTLAWKIPWMEKPGRLQSMGFQRVGHD